jgi:hypothetical protein
VLKLEEHKQKQKYTTTIYCGCIICYTFHLTIKEDKIWTHWSTKQFRGIQRPTTAEEHGSLIYYEGCKLSNSFGIISSMQANRGWTGTGSRYTGKKNKSVC